MQTKGDFTFASLGACTGLGPTLCRALCQALGYKKESSCLPCAFS